MINESGLIFKEIDSEEFRLYRWSDGFEVLIKEPTHINVSESGGHRIFDIEGVSHYIPKGWSHLSWLTKEGRPNFVKQIENIRYFKTKTNE